MAGFKGLLSGKNRLKTPVNYRPPEYAAHPEDIHEKQPSGERIREGDIYYERYDFTVRERIRYTVQGVVLIGFICYLFYQSWVAFFLLLPLLKFYFKRKQQECTRKRIMRLVDDFKSFLEVFSSNLQAGYSVENAIEESYKDMEIMSDQEADLRRELHRMINGLRNNVDISDMICRFAERSRVEEIIDFSGVFRTAKRSGGNMNAMIRQCSDLIHDKMEVRSEIRTVTAEKQLECRLMTYIPFAIMFYINLTTPGYFSILYHNLTGITIMTVCLAVYLAAVYLTGRLVRIEV